jgi:Family of unknown function (DUF6527)
VAEPVCTTALAPDGGLVEVRFYDADGIRKFTWKCPLCRAVNEGRLGPHPIGGFYRDTGIHPAWVLAGTEEKPTLAPSLGCWSCYPLGHFWLRDGVLVRA